MSPTPLRHVAVLFAFALALFGVIVGLGRGGQPAGAASVSGTPAPPPGPALRQAPSLTRGEDGAPPPRAGFLPPAVDLSHLRGEWTGPDIPDLPTRFDWRQSGKVSPVKNQGACNACYAFAAVAAFESRLMLDGAGLWDFSENQAKECTFYTRGCAPGNPMEVYALFSQKGAVLESCDPYVSTDVACKTNCPYQKTLLDWRQISGNVVPPTDALKNYIYTYGPVHASLYIGSGGNAWEQEFNRYDGSYTLYYAGMQLTNHSVLIIGWDDNLIHAGGRGGWIVKNSWGSAWGGAAGYGSEGGYFTIAYGSALIGEYAGFVHSWQDYDPAGRLLFYDEGGYTGSFGYDTTTAWGLAQFFPPENTTVTRVEFWTTDITTDVDVYLYDRFDGSKPIGLLASKLNLAYSEMGYHSVALDMPVPVIGGGDVVAVVKFTNRTTHYPVPMDKAGPYETGRTFASADGSSWVDLSGYNADVAIRLRTAPPAATATPTRTLTPTMTRTATKTPTVTRVMTRTPTVSPGARRIYLPLMLRVFPVPRPTPTPTSTTTANRGIYGRVSYGGDAAGGVGLALRFFDGAAWSTAATTTTDQNGRYAFTGRPGLASGQGYYVRFGPNETNPAYLFAWYGTTITAYTAGSSVPGGDFDIANVFLLSPAPGARLPLPVTFTWQQRGLPGDSYTLLLFDPDSDDLWYTDDLGDVGSFALSALPQGVVWGKAYGWYVQVSAGPDSYGVSYYNRLVTFAATALDRESASRMLETQRGDMRAGEINLRPSTFNLQPDTPAASSTVDRPPHRRR